MRSHWSTKLPELTLYHYYRSTCSWRVRWALDYKGIKHHLVHVNLLNAEQSTETFKKKNPSGFVPTLCIDGEYYSESMAILEWLEENFPTPNLLPVNPYSRMRVRQLCLTIVAGTQPLQNLTAQRNYSKDKENQKKYAQYWISRGLDAYEKLLQASKGTYSFGEQLSLADICLIPQCYNALRFGLNLSRYPLIAEIYNTCITDPHYLATHPDNYLKG